MTTKIVKRRIPWLVMRYPEHARMLQDNFTLAELVEKFFDCASGLNIISRTFSPDAEDIEQMEGLLLLHLWWIGDVKQNALEILVKWIGEFRQDTGH